MNARTGSEGRLLAIVAYPTFGRGDRSWVEGIRAHHYPPAAAIDAHFTLVFPCRVAEEELASVAATTERIEFST